MREGLGFRVDYITVPLGPLAEQMQILCEQAAVCIVGFTAEVWLIPFGYPCDS